MKEISLSGKVALVTGGGSGIGRGIVLGLASAGADVAILDIDAAAADQTAAEARKYDVRAATFQCDVMDRDQVRQSVAKTNKTLGGVDILVNNAGGVRPGPFLGLSDKSIDRQISLNLGALFTATRAVAEVMIAAGREGVILNIASIEGLRAAPGFSVYAACKAAMVSFTRTCAVEFAEHGIRVNCIAPDFVVTDGVRRINPGVDREEQRAARQRYIPMGRGGTLDDIGSAAMFLASDLAGYITGTVLHVDGGTWASSGWTRDGSGGWEVVPGMNAAFDAQA